MFTVVKSCFALFQTLQFPTLTLVDRLSIHSAELADFDGTFRPEKICHDKTLTDFFFNIRQDQQFRPTVSGTPGADSQKTS